MREMGFLDIGDRVAGWSSWHRSMDRILKLAIGRVQGFLKILRFIIAISDFLFASIS